MLSLERSGRLSSTRKPHSSGFIERTHIRTLQHHANATSIERTSYVL
jgi:hypothetical protein